MKLNKIKSNFRDGRPYIEIQEPFKLEDFDVVVKKQDPNPDKALSSKLYRNAYAAVYLFPKEDVIKQLQDSGVEHIMGMFSYNDYYQPGNPGKKYYLHKSKSSRDVRFTGLRTADSKKRKYLKFFNEFIEDFDTNSDKYVQELLEDANDSLKRRIEGNNERYITSHKELYASTKYKDAWEETFSEDENITKLSEERASVQKQLDELKSKVNQLKEQERQIKVNIAKEEVKTTELPQEVKDIILDELNSDNAWKETSLRGFRFG